MFSSRPIVAVFLLAVASASGTVFGQTAWYENFEGMEASWREAEGNTQYRILDHGRVQNEAHTGKGSEWLRLSASGGSYVYIAHDVGRPIVIDELMPSVWIKSDKVGMQLAARIVLPRTIDPKNGRPVSTLVSGSSYTDVGRWQELRITDIPLLLNRQIRFLHGQLGPNVDEREAYVDAILLNVYSGPGVTNVWIDDLDIAGYVSSSPPAQAQTVNPSPRVGNAAGNSGWTPKGSDSPRATPFVSVRPKKHEVKLTGSVLTVDGRPFFPRAIEHQGEPLSVLKQLGFNTVWLKRLPPPEILEEADRLGLWVICPSPRPPRLDGGGDQTTVLADVGPAFDPVLMWDLGRDLTAEHLETTRNSVEQIRGADRRGARPLICRPSEELRGYSRLDNEMILLIDRQPLGTSMELVDYSAWVRRQPLLARPGTPVWTTVQTQANEALRRQIAVLEPGNPTPLEVSYEQMRLVALTAIASNIRGLLFLSSAPLDASNADARQRALAIQLLNLELELVEPWGAAGNFVTTAASSKAEVTATVLRTERARLLLPIWYSPGAQCVPAQSASTNLSLVAPGVPESANAFELSPGGVKPIGHKRVTGGMRVNLADFGLTAEVLLAQDPLVVNSIIQRSAGIARQAAQLQRDLAVHKLYAAQLIAAQLDRRVSAKAPTAAWLDTARKNLQWCDAQLAAGDYTAARLGANRAMNSLRMVERFYWENAVKELSSPVTSPAATAFQTLPCHWRLIDHIRGSRFGPNLLPGGDFENLNLMYQSGWRYLKSSAAGVQTAADLVTGSAYGGALGLRLIVAPDDPQNPPAMLETPPIRFISPSITVEAGQIVCIHGWVNVPKPIAGSVDGLMIFDSLGGEALTDRIGNTTGWKQFALYRVAPQSGTMNVTFALSGLGEAWIDDVYVQVLDAPGAGLTAR